MKHPISFVPPMISISKKKAALLTLTCLLVGGLSAGSMALAETAPAQAHPSPAVDTAIPLPAPLDAGKASDKNAEITIKPPEVADPLAEPPKTDPGQAADPLAWPAQQGAKPAAAAPSAPAPIAQPAPAAVQPPAAPPAAVVPAAADVKPENAKSDKGSLQPAQADSASFENRISALEKQIQELKKEVSDLQSKKQTDEGVEKVQAAPKAKKEQRHSAKKSSRTKTSSRGSSRKWVLKSAKPGIAWLAERGSGELHTVSIGENLPGLGQIKSIAQDSSGRWLVSGTYGKVSQ